MVKKVFEHMTGMSSALRWTFGGMCYQIGASMPYQRQAKTMGSKDRS